MIYQTLKSISHYKEIGTRCKSPPDNVGYFKQLERCFRGYYGFSCSEKSSSSVNFHAGFTFAYTTLKCIFKGLHFIFYFISSHIFYTQCSKLEDLFKPLQCNRMVNCFLHMGTHATNEVTNIQYPQVCMDSGCCCAEASLDNTCWSFKSLHGTGQMWMQAEVFEVLQV